MARAKIAITLDQDALTEIDRLVIEGSYPNRSKAIEAAVIERVQKEHRLRLARECAKLNERQEQDLADERFTGEGEWPEY